MSDRKAYPSDLTDAEWELLELVTPRGIPKCHDRDDSATRNRERHPLRVAEWLSVENATQRFTRLGHGLLLLSYMAQRGCLGSGLAGPAQTDAAKARPRRRAKCSRD